MFYVPPNKFVRVEMMRAINRIPYYKSATNGYTSIGLEYVEKRYVMFFVKPDLSDPSLAGLIEKLTPKELSSMMNETLQRPRRWVDYKIPRVKFSWQGDLTAHLRNLGIRSASNARTSNFSNMFTERVYLSGFEQATNIKIDETGTVAGFAPMIMKKCGDEKPDCDDEPLPFVLDQPFLVILYDSFTNIILSYGVVRDPQGCLYC
jgi:serine protease inhibitor